MSRLLSKKRGGRPTRSSRPTVPQRPDGGDIEARERAFRRLVSGYASDEAQVDRIVRAWRAGEIIV